MQKIIISDNWGFHVGTDAVVNLLIEVYGHDTMYWNLYPYDCEDGDLIKLRTDPILQEAIMKKPVNEKGSYVIGKHFDDEDITLKIIEIPDDVKWHIDSWECTIGEYVCEDYRTWS